jgi:hypothetical protein
VLTGDVRWPEKMWGMNLGSVVHNIIRNNFAYLDKQLDLESIGFDYSPQESGTEFPSERECRRILQDLHFPFVFDKIRPEWLRSPLTYELIELNGYNEQLKIAFEYQGEHHAKLSYFNNYDKQLLFEQQERDNHKVSECARRGITLIVIPSKYNYEDPLAMRNFIISELSRHGKLPLDYLEEY